MTEYYSSNIKSRNSNIKNMNKFHNYVKRYLYNKYSKKSFVLELAGGRGGDLFKLIENHVKFVTFIDYDSYALNEAKKRYNEFFKKTNNNLEIEFFKGDAREDLTKNIRKNMYDLVNIHFAIHYMMSNLNTIENIFKNVDYGLKNNGFFIFSSMDGNKVNNLFNEYKINNNETLHLKKNNKIVFKLKKLFPNNNLDKFGQKIEVFVETIGSNIENLTNFEFLINFFKKRNYIVLQDKNFSLLRENFLSKYKLSPIEIQFSNLNRFVVLQKKK